MANTRRVTLLDAARNAANTIEGAPTRVNGARVTIQIPIAPAAVVTIRGGPDGVNWVTLTSVDYLTNDLTDNLLAARGEGAYTVNERVEWIQAQLSTGAAARYIVVASIHEEND